MEVGLFVTSAEGPVEPVVGALDTVDDVNRSVHVKTRERDAGSFAEVLLVERVQAAGPAGT